MPVIPPTPLDALWALRRACGYFWVTDPLYGALGDGTNDTTKIEAARAAAEAASGILFFPPGKTFIYTPSGTGTYLKTWARGGIMGGGPTSVLKVSATSGNYQAIFYDLGGGCSNFFFDNFRIDQNAANQNGRVQAGVDGTPQFAVYLTGVCTNVSFRGMQFDTCTGTNTVWIAGSAGNKNITLDRCYFSYKKTATTTPIDDNSAVYIGGKNLRVVGCTFYSGSYSDAPGGACELHGAPAVFTGNIIDGYQVGLWIAAQYFSADQDVASDVTATGNTFSRVACGPRILCVTSPQNASAFVTNVTIGHNTTHILQAGSHHDAAVAMGIQIETGGAGCTVDSIKIGPGLITFEADSRSTSTRWSTSVTGPSAGTGLYMVCLSGTVSNVSVDGLTIKGAPSIGAAVGGNAAASVLNRVKIRNLDIIDAGGNTNASIRSGLVLSGALTDCEIDFKVTDTATGATPNGQYAWQVYPYAAAVRTYFRPKPATLGGSGSFSYYYDLNANSLLSGPTEGSQNVSYAASILPDPFKGSTVYVGTLTGNVSLTALPTAVPSFTTLAMKGQRLRLVFTQDGSGTHTHTFASAYRKNWSPDTSAAKINSIDFECDGTNMIQVGSAVGL